MIMDNKLERTCEEKALSQHILGETGEKTRNTYKDN
jgi:hypothetical protein